MQSTHVTFLSRDVSVDCIHGYSRAVHDVYDLSPPHPPRAVESTLDTVLGSNSYEGRGAPTNKKNRLGEKFAALRILSLAYTYPATSPPSVEPTRREGHTGETRLTVKDRALFGPLVHRRTMRQAGHLSSLRK